MCNVGSSGNSNTSNEQKSHYKIIAHRHRPAQNNN
jgi:hypothetical protein